MTASLEGPWLKLDRAEKHREELETAVRAFTDAESIKITVDHEGGARLWVIDEPGVVPPELGPMISDILHNLRSALDYLATQLVMVHDPHAGLSDVGFPIFDNSTDYVERGLPMVKKMSDVVRTAIEAAQPYHRKTRHKTDRLLLLNQLNNEYKHRDFRLVALSIEGGDGWNAPDGLVPSFGPLKGRTVLMSWPDEDPASEVNWTFRLDVVFAEGPWLDQRVCATLQEIEDVTRQVVNQIAGVGGLAS